MKTFPQTSLHETLASFLFLEEMLKAVFEHTVSPYDARVNLLGRQQVGGAALRVE